MWLVCLCAVRVVVCHVVSYVTWAHAPCELCHIVHGPTTNMHLVAGGSGPLAVAWLELS